MSNPVIEHLDEALWMTVVEQGMFVRSIDVTRVTYAYLQEDPRSLPPKGHHLPKSWKGIDLEINNNIDGQFIINHSKLGPEGFNQYMRQRDGFVANKKEFKKGPSI